jgi:hypothetical protein
MEAYQARVIEEKKELDAKISKLNAFLDSAEAEILPAVDLQLLITQWVHMSLYSSILQRRIDRFS